MTEKKKDIKNSEKIILHEKEGESTVMKIIQNVAILTMAWILFKILVAADRCGIKDDLNLSARFWIFSCASGSTFTVYAICDLQQPKFKFTENDLHPFKSRYMYMY